MKKRKTKVIIILIAIVVIGIGGVIGYNLISYPLHGTLFELLGISQHDIGSVSITHYGETLTLTEGKSVEEVISLFEDCSFTRGQSDYFAHTSGGDWGIRLTSKDGNFSDTFGFYPGMDNPVESRTSIMLGDYWYICDKTITVDLVESYWDAEFKEKFEKQ